LHLSTNDMSTGASSFSESPRLQAWRAAARASICGYVDAYSLLKFGVFASFMSGNTTSGGVEAGQVNFARAAHSLLPIPFFLLGILIGTLLTQSEERRALPRLSAVVGAMLLLDAAANYFGIAGWFSIMILSGAMGILNMSITQVGGQPVSLGFITGDLNNLARQIAMGIQRKLATETCGRAGVLAGLWAAFFSGAVLGTILLPLLAVWTLLLPAVSLFAFAMLERPNSEA
jgi:uncharacterized membrane protein YoaK (UPF0700 family)